MILPGLLILIPVAIPNLIWALAPKPPPPAPSLPESPIHGFVRILSLIEAGGRGAVMVIPCFLKIRIVPGMNEVLLLTISGLALAIYYWGWARYFIGGRSAALLFCKLGFLPVPLAVVPIVYFLVFSILTQSAVLGVVSALFGGAHIYLSIQKSRIHAVKRLI